jgi:ribosomal protein S18 acetylase RimI-like enzyme
MFGFISKAKKAIKHFTKPKTSYYILAIAVFEDFRGQGVSAKLLSYVERQARLGGYTSLALEVEGYNYSAIRAYQKYGFVKIKEVPLEKFSKSLKINKHASMWLMRKDLR